MRSPLSAGAGALVMVVALSFAGRSESEPTKAVTQLGRIAIVNLEYVIKNYDKAKKLDAEIEEDIARHQREDSELRSRIREIVDAIQDPRTPVETKARCEKYLRRPGLEDGDPETDFKRAVAKKT
jgi:Skp family chaperone for outer membrane proteins